MRSWAALWLATGLALTALLTHFPTRAVRADTPDGTRIPYVRIGDRAPVFRAADENGRIVRSADLFGKRVVVLTFFQGDYFKDGTEQLTKLRDDLGKISAEGAEVVAVSGDKTSTHRLFKKQHGLNFALLSDYEGAVGTEWGLPMSGAGC